jgi:hypothetical protein
MWEPDWKPTSGSHMTENRSKCVYIYIFVFEEPNRFSHRTQIRFSECSVSFIGSSCSSSHLELLLFSCCHYFFPIALILFLLLLLFSHGVALSMWWICLIINYLIIKIDFYLRKILIIRLWKPDVKTSCCIYENQLIWVLAEFEKNKNLITWPVLISSKN